MDRRSILHIPIYTPSQIKKIDQYVIPTVMCERKIFADGFKNQT